MDHRTPDPRDPFVLDVHDLGRSPGSMRALDTTLEAPAGFGTDIVAVPLGSSVHLDLRLEAVMEGVYVSGLVTADAVGECARCLTELEIDVDVDVAELFLYPDRAAALAEEQADEENPDEVYLVENELIDLEPPLRDAVVTSLPFSPLCRPDCQGLCSECGADLNDPANEDHSHEILDPRWKALAALGGGDADDTAEGGER